MQNPPISPSALRIIWGIMTLLRCLDFHTHRGTYWDLNQWSFLEEADYIDCFIVVLIISLPGLTCKRRVHGTMPRDCAGISCTRSTRRVDVKRFSGWDGETTLFRPMEAFSASSPSFTATSTANVNKHNSRRQNENNSNCEWTMSANTQSLNKNIGIRRGSTCFNGRWLHSNISICVFC